jgi:CRISPR/Cas system CSM-associated protein Csm3 (group 7 of RAMP superfamily)
MANDEFPPDYDVGFGKPPKSSRFRRGVSGNPRGRPKGALNFKTLLQRTLSEKVVITENGVRKTVSKLEVAINRFVSKAMKGDPAAMRQLTSLASFIDMEAATTGEGSQFTEADRKIVDRVVEKFGRYEKK